jgi:hypothetical protein
MLTVRVELRIRAKPIKNLRHIAGQYAWGGVNGL